MTVRLCKAQLKMILLEIATLKVPKKNIKKSKLLFAVVLQWEAQERINALTFLPSNLTRHKKLKMASHIPVGLIQFSLASLFPHCCFNTFFHSAGHLFTIGNKINHSGEMKK